MNELFKKQRERFQITAKQSRISRKKAKLANDDYKIIKCVEAVLSQYMIDNPNFEFPYDLQALIASRNEIRDDINQTEKELAEMNQEEN
jgi:uncharacterized protein involved in exopolysaccharide biosynthesis